MWFWMAIALAGGRADVRSDLDAGRYESAMGSCRVELLSHPDRGWALRGLEAAAGALAQQAVSEAHAAFQAGRPGAGEAALARARGVLARAQASGAPVDPASIDAVGDALIAEAAAGWVRKGDASLAAGDAVQAVERYQVARSLVPDDGAHLVAAHRQAAGQAQAAGDRLGAARHREAAAVLSGDPEDLRVAAALHASEGDGRRAAGDCRGAVAALRAAAHLDARHQGALEAAQACARVPVALQVRGPVEAEAAVRGALRQRGSEHLAPLAPREVPPGAARLEVVLVAEEPVTGDVTSRTVRRRRGGIVVEVLDQREAPVTVRWRGTVRLAVDGAIVVEAPVEAEAASTARWYGTPRALEAGGVRGRGGKGPSGEKAPAVAEAQAEAAAAVARAVGAQVAEQVVPVLEPPTPPPPAPGSDGPP